MRPLLLLDIATYVPYISAERRSTHATNLNTFSSRSHCVVTLWYVSFMQVKKIMHELNCFHTDQGACRLDESALTVGRSRRQRESQECKDEWRAHERRNRYQSVSVGSTLGVVANGGGDTAAVFPSFKLDGGNNLLHCRILRHPCCQSMLQPFF
jgi:hypothetical protein